MNERIHELAEQAGMTAMNRRSDGLYVVSQDVFAKFADLIVKECLDVGMSRIAGYALYDYEKEKESTIAYREHLKQYFGIE